MSRLRSLILGYLARWRGVANENRDHWPRSHADRQAMQIRARAIVERHRVKRPRVANSGRF